MTLRYNHNDHALRALLVAGVILAAGSCAQALRQVPVAPAAGPPINQLWIAPVDLSSRDLYLGPGGKALVPDSASYTFLKRDTSGASGGYDVRDTEGREWKVKFGIEAQPEIVVSRLLWAIGFHQPPVYYVERWTLTGEDAGVQPAGRFRAELPDQKVTSEWSWFENPFVGTRPFGGLVVANLLLNNWDWKTSNNKVYQVGESGPVRRMYVVRDLGASLGKTSQPALLRLPGFIRSMQGTKNDLEGFESQKFVRMDKSGKLDFDYAANYGDLVKHLTAEDVRWTCQLFSRLSDTQISDAFRAAGYPTAQTQRYVRKIREKIAEGLALPGASALR